MMLAGVTGVRWDDPWLCCSTGFMAEDGTILVPEDMDKGFGGAGGAGGALTDPQAMVNRPGVH
jgi:hypothetical protein